MDDFHNPTPHAAAAKSTVDSVLYYVAKLGNTLLSLLSSLLAAALILYSAVVIYDTFYTQQAASDPYKLLHDRIEILEEGVTPESGAEILAGINEDYRAWLTVYDSYIDYPVVQGMDDLFYATHDIYKEISLTGAIYLSAGNDGEFEDSYNLIYGHHMDNKAMFGGLDEFKGESYFASHREGVIVSPSGVYDLYTFAVITTDAYENKIYFTGDRMDEVLSFLREMRDNSDGKTEVLIFDEAALEGADKIVALSTCADVNTNGRLVVFATMTKQNLIELKVEGYDGVYDAQTHGPALVEVNHSEGTVFSYSLDGGETWIPGLPEIRDAGTVEAIIKAENDVYGVATAEVTLTVHPKDVTVKVKDAFKYYGDPDPAWETEYITGIVDGFIPVYSIGRTNPYVQDVGVYPGVLVANGEELQGNYRITYLPGTFSIVKTGGLALTAQGYSGVYDTQSHSVSGVQVNVPGGTLIEYSVDGGLSWSTVPPEIKDVGVISVLIRATNPGYDSAAIEVTLEVTPAEVVVKAGNAQKKSGEADPEFHAEVTGILDGYQISYNIHRPGKGRDESAGFYRGAIVPYGEEYQGNYRVIYESGDFVIEGGSGRPGIIDFFDPDKGNGTPAWALVNLICTIITAYLFLPLLHLKAKFGRIKKMKKFNEEKFSLMDAEDLDAEQTEERDLIYDFAVEEKQKSSDAAVTRADISEDDFGSAVDALYYHVKKFVRRFRSGFGLELLSVIAAVVAFILTEDMRLPMVLIDKWTPLMVLIMLLCWGFDTRLMRYRDKFEADEREKEKEGAKE